MRTLCKRFVPEHLRICDVWGLFGGVCFVLCVMGSVRSILRIMNKPGPERRLGRFLASA